MLDENQEYWPVVHVIGLTTLEWTAGIRSGTVWNICDSFGAIYMANISVYTTGDEQFEVCKFDVDKSPFDDIWKLLFMHVDNSSGSEQRNASFLTSAGLSPVKFKS